MNVRTVAFSILLIGAIAACGGSDDVGAPSTETDVSAAGADTVTAEEVVAGAAENAEDLADDLVETLEETQAAVGGGSATLTVGDETWVFEPVLCAFGPDQIGQEGAEFVLSSLQDGMQMYFSIDSFGHSASLDDIKDFANPSVSLSTGPTDDFIMVDGKNFSGAADFFDGTSDSREAVPGSFSGTCP